MDKSNKRTLVTSPGKSVKHKSSETEIPTIQMTQEDAKNQDSTDWYNLNPTDKSWKISEIPPLSEIGKTYVENSSKKPDPLIDEDWEKASQMSQELSDSISYSLDNDISRWIQLIDSIPTIPRRLRKDKTIYTLGLKLIASPISSFPGATKMKDHWSIPHNHLAVAWIACVNKFGAYEPNPPTICYKDQDLPIKEWGKTIISKSITNLSEQAFQKDEILVQGNQGAHDICQWAIKKKLGSESSSEPWENTIVNLWNSINRNPKEQLLLATLIRLAKTPPNQMPGWNKNKGIPISSVNLAWVASQWRFGNIWKAKYSNPNGSTSVNINNYFKPIPDKNLERINSKSSPNRTKQNGTINDDEDPNANKDILENPYDKSYIHELTPPKLKSFIKDVDYNNTVPLTSLEPLPKNDLAFPNSPQNISKDSKSRGNISKSIKENSPSFLPSGSPKKKVKISSPNNSQTKSSRISKGKVSTGKKHNKKNSIKKSILRLKIPIQVDSVQEWNAATSLAVTTIKAIWKILLQVDPNNSMILTWSTLKANSKLKALKIDSALPSSKNKIHEKYIEEFKLNWSNSNSPTEMRMILGHRKDIDFDLSNKNAIRKLEDLECEVFR